MKYPVSTRNRQRGFTLVEVIVAFTIMLVLSTMALPLARYTVRRNKEAGLRDALKEMRQAIDRFKDMSDQQRIGPPELDTFGYPKKLQDLVDGVKLTGTPDKKMKFLRRIPLDPMTNTRDWGVRSMQDDPDSMAGGGQNVFDVFTKSTEKAADGTPYSQW